MSGKRVFKHLSGVITTAGTTYTSLNPPSGYLYSIISATVSLTTGTGTGSRYADIQGMIMADETGAVGQNTNIAYTGTQTTTSTSYEALSNFYVNSNPSGGSSYVFRGPVIIWPTISASTHQVGLVFAAELVSGDSAAYDLLVEVIPYAEG